MRRRRPSLPQHALSDSRLDARALRVLAAFSLFERQGVSQPSRQHISAVTELPETRVSKCVSRLVALGWISRNGAGGRGRKYTYVIQWDYCPHETVPGGVTVSDHETVPGGVTVSDHETVPGGVTVSENGAGRGNRFGENGAGRGNRFSGCTPKIYKNNINTTTTDLSDSEDPAPAQVVVVSDLVFPKQLNADERESALMLVRHHPGVAQQLLDELQGAIDTPGAIRSSPIGFLRGCCKRAAAGDFTPEKAMRVADTRRVRQENEARLQAAIADKPRLASANREAAPPETADREKAKEAASQHLSALAGLRRGKGIAA